MGTFSGKMAARFEFATFAPFKFINNCFYLRIVLKSFIMQGSNQEVTKVVSLYKKMLKI